MRKAARAVVIAFLAFLSSVLIGVAAVITSAITLAATAALVVPGTGTPNANIVENYMKNAYDRYVASANPALPSECTTGTSCTLTGIDYPASFWPLSFIPGWCEAGRCEKWNVSVEEGVEGLDDQVTAALADPNNAKVVLFGYSQGARVVSIQKEALGPNNPDRDRLEIVLIGNISRPNGGLWSRLSFLPTIPILDVSFGNPTPTYTEETGIKTTDISFEYDGVSDFPLYPVNLLAVANAIAGFQYVHGYYLVPNGNGPEDQLPWGYTPEDIEAFVKDPNNPTKGDTTYVTIPAKSLPILQPFIDLGNATGTSAIVNPILEFVQPMLKVLIDTGYDRTANPGDPMTFRLIPLINPIKLAVDLVGAFFQGIQDAFDGVPIVPTVTPPPTPAPVAPVGDPSPFSTLARSGAEAPSNDEFTPVSSNDDSVLVRTVKSDPKPVADDTVTQKPADDDTDVKPAADDTDVKPADDTDTLKPAADTDVKPADDTDTLKPAADDTDTLKPAATGAVVKPFQLQRQPKPGTASSTTQSTKPDATKPGPVLQPVTSGMDDAINGFMKPRGSTTDAGEPGDTGDTGAASTGTASTGTQGQAAA